MATKTIQTRIKNRFDTLAEWSKSGVTLLPGEIALVSVTTQQIDQATGDVVNVPAVLMKVGEEGKTFSELPWVSALAADVYDWAKNATAEEVPVTIAVGSTSTAGTLGGWIKSINDKAATNASSISANTAAITKLNGSDTTSGSVAKAIKDAIEALDVTTSSGTGNFVKAVTQNNGKISVTKGAIAETDLPSISSDKINIGTGTTDGTLSKKLSTMDAAIAANTSKLTGHTDAAINTLIDAKINALDGDTDSGTSGSGKYVSKVVQTNGKVATTYTSFPTAGASTAGITKLYTSVGTSTDGTVTRKVVNDINTQVETNKTDIANLKTVVAGGVHFRGTVSSAPSASTTVVNNVTIAVGDVVIYDGKEYICTAVTEGAPSWEQLGDVTRIGNLETKINNLDYSAVTDGAATNSKFVSKVTQTNGKIAATYARPSASDISYGDSSDVNAKLGSIDADIATKANSAEVYTKGQTDSAISTAIGNLDFTAPSASGNTTSFIDSVSQTDGKITATKKTITSASTSAKGIVQLNDTVESTSTTLAATANAVKTAYDKGAQGVADAAAALAAANHSHSSYVNQNAFSSIAVSGQTTVAADSATDTVTFVGSNVTITTDATNDKVTFTVASGSTSAKGLVQLNNTVTSTSTSLAATANAVKTAYDKGAEGVAAAAAIAGNYIKISNDNLVNQAGDVIIFDCGGAADL